MTLNIFSTYYFAQQTGFKNDEKFQKPQYKNLWNNLIICFDGKYWKI